MSIIDHVIGLVESRIELAKVSAKEEVSKVAAKLVLGVIMGVVAFFIWFYLSLALGLFLNDVTESRYLGVLIVAGIHVIILVLIYFFHDKFGMNKVIGDSMDKTLYSNDDEDEGRA
ncbi:MAG: phage holin family protein [Cyclobacteriaceae bacterium]